MKQEKWKLDINQCGQTQFDDDINAQIKFMSLEEAETVFWSLLKVPYILEKLKFMDVYKDDKEKAVLSYSYPNIITCYIPAENIKKQQIIDQKARVIYDSSWSKQDFKKQMNFAKKIKDKKMLMQIKQKAKEHGLILLRSRNKKKEEEELELLYRTHEM